MKASQDVGLFGTKTRTDVLLVVHMLGDTYPTQIARLLDVSLSQVQGALLSLERAGVLVERIEGRQRRVKLNPRYAVLNELKAVLDIMANHDVPLQKRLAEMRRRPRLNGKGI